MEAIPERQLRARHDADTVTVYQAYPPSIADAALRAGRFADGFDRGRMTWIKPSFLWMMYRSGWAAKPGQERVLAVRIRRAGFDWAVATGALSSYEPEVHADREAWRQSLSSPVRIQWDPERDLHLRPLPHRTIQIGLSGPAVDAYVDEWITGLDDVTPACHEIRRLVAERDLAGAAARLPVETAYRPAGSEDRPQ